MSEQHVSQTTTARPEPGLERRVFTLKATSVVWLVVGLLEALLAFRVGLKLIAAYVENPFVAFIYNFSSLFVAPFTGLTATPTAGGMVLELSSLIAMLVYALLGWAVARIVWVIFYRPREAAMAITQEIQSERRIP